MKTEVPLDTDWVTVEAIVRDFVAKATRPTVLDAFCGEGAASMGYVLAGFDVLGVDIQKRLAKRYPFLYVRADAVEFIMRFGHLFDLIHTSPPCQHASAGTRALRSVDPDLYPALIPDTRAALQKVGVPYVIENVKGADLIDPVTLCGTMFGLTAIDDDGTRLEMWRHRGFETSFPLQATPTCQHGRYSQQVAGSYGGARRDKDEARYVRHGGYVPSRLVQEALMGVDWMTQNGLFQAIPPVYAEWIGLAALRWLRRVA